MEHNGTEKANLTPKQLKAIDALLSESSIDAAAKAAGTGRTTIYRWMKEPAFEQAYREGRASLFQNNLQRLQSACGQAIDVLIEVMGDKSAPVSVRLTAACKTLELAMRARADIETEQRLRALERAFEPVRKNG